MKINLCPLYPQIGSSRGIFPSSEGQKPVIKSVNFWKETHDLNDDITANHQFETTTSIFEPVTIRYQLTFHWSHLHYFVAIWMDVKCSEDGGSAVSFKFKVNFNSSNLIPVSQIVHEHSADRSIVIDRFVFRSRDHSWKTDADKLLIWKGLPSKLILLILFQMYCPFVT